MSIGARILFATSELNPLVKTGGLADVSQALPNALLRLGYDVRVILPAYPDALDGVEDVTTAGMLRIDGDTIPLLLAKTRDLPDLYLVADAKFARAGNPYLAEDGDAWPDNGTRFGRFCREVAAVAMGRTGDPWRTQLLHCNDWQTGLAPALVHAQPSRPATVFTIHNMAYQGLFDATVFQSLSLPTELWSPHGLEFFGQLSFIKGGLVYADRITTVSPTYAREIQTESFGFGLEGLLRARTEHLVGIVNGIDVNEWNPRTDPLIDTRYDASTLDDKKLNKRALQREMGFAVDDQVPLIGFVGRLVAQKGIDLILGSMSDILARGVQIVLLGTGDRRYERAMKELTARHTGGVGARIGYDHALSHLIEAGADLFLMPSRFEPCGLNQLYSQRYGTLPIVRCTGGLADTVVDATNEAIESGTASGFAFREDTEFLRTLDRALALYEDPRTWRMLQQQAMAKDLSWDQGAAAYAALYEELITTEGSA